MLMILLASQRVTRVKEMKPRDVLLLQNVRFLAEETLDRTPEEHAASILVRRLGSLADVFVNDAFSAAHRSHASLVGFTCTLPSSAGRNMERELLYDQRVFTNPEHPVVYCLGGSKPDDILAVMKYALEKGVVDDVLTSGVLGQLFLLAAGMNLGEETYRLLSEKHYLDCLADVKDLLNRFGKRIRSPVDLCLQRCWKTFRSRRAEFARHGDRCGHRERNDCCIHSPVITTPRRW